MHKSEGKWGTNTNAPHPPNMREGKKGKGGKEWRNLQKDQVQHHSTAQHTLKWPCHEEDSGPTIANNHEVE